MDMTAIKNGAAALTDEVISGGANVHALRGRKRATIEFSTINAQTILRNTYPPIKCVVPKLLFEGFTVLAGRQKLGKTWLALDWSIAVATGGYAMGSVICEQGDVLYCDLENGERRVKRRLESLGLDGRDQPSLNRLDFVTGAAPALDAGFIEALDNWRKASPNPRLVVIDVIQRIKPVGNATRNAYENDYSIWSPLQAWATKHGIAVLGLHHTRKGGADDPLEALSGSNGLSACADTTIVLDGRSDGISLYVRGRDVEEGETALRFREGRWSIIGEAAAVRLSAQRKEALEVLYTAPDGMSPTEVAGALGKSVGAIKKLLFDMERDGDLVKAGRGLYRHPAPKLEPDE